MICSNDKFPMYLVGHTIANEIEMIEHHEADSEVFSVIFIEKWLGNQLFWLTLHRIDDY